MQGMQGPIGMQFGTQGSGLRPASDIACGPLRAYGARPTSKEGRTMQTTIPRPAPRTFVDAGEGS
jgi:hypothetical protein